MNYADTREKLASGDLLAWSHRAWGSWYDFQVQMVRVFTQSEYCHVGVVWRVAERVFALEAVGAGVRIFPLSRLTPFYWVATRPNWTPEVERFALAQVGASYSKWQAVKAYLGLLDIGGDSVWQCAEYVTVMYQLAEVPWASGVTPTPSKLVEAAQSAGCATYLVNS